MKRNIKSTGRHKDVEAAITRVFEGLPIVDAKNDLRIVIMQSDINKGKPKDFDSCIFAQACKRVFNSKKVLLMRSVAYISLPDESGNYRVERFCISAPGMKVISDFDRGIMPLSGTSFVFKAPSPACTLNGKRKAVKLLKKKKQDALILGDMTGDVNEDILDVPKKQKKTVIEPVFDVRNGQGLIQMKRH